ncbi:MAG: sigma-70 family RNA polymerase sigma factor [Candidatus Eisenbacteria bacterium]
MREKRVERSDAAAWSDAQILAGIAAGDTAAEERFCLHFAPRIRAKVYATLRGRPDRDDLASEILQAALTALRDGRFRGECALPTFVHAIARNKIAEHIRRRRPETVELSEDIPAPTVSPMDEISRQQAARALRDAVGRLKPKYRQVLYLYYYRGLTIAQVAERLGVSGRRVSEWKDYGLKVLRAKCGESLREYR